MKFRYWPIFGLVAVLCISLAMAKNPEIFEPDPQLGGIGVKVKVKGPLAISAPSHAVSVFFVKVDEDVNIETATEIYRTDFNRKKQVYLLNVEPGRYVAVGAYAESNAANVPSENVYFDKETIAATEVQVEAGKITFMGDIVVKVKTGMKKADNAQNHYADMIGRGIGISYGVNINLNTGQTSSIFGVGHVTRAGSLLSLSNDRETEIAFWELAAEKTFKKEPAWQALARQQLDAIRSGS